MLANPPRARYIDPFLCSFEMYLCFVFPSSRRVCRAPGICILVPLPGAKNHEQPGIPIWPTLNSGWGRRDKKEENCLRLDWSLLRPIDGADYDLSSILFNYVSPEWRMALKGRVPGRGVEPWHGDVRGSLTCSLFVAYCLWRSSLFFVCLLCAQ